jgi:hypothetical protein
LDVVLARTHFTARRAVIVGATVLMLATACSGFAKRDLTQPLFWTPGPAPAPQEREAGFSDPRAGLSARTATATRAPPADPTPSNTPSPTPTSEPSASPTAPVSVTPTPSGTPISFPTPSPTPSATAMIPTATPEPTATVPPAVTATPVPSSTPQPTATPTPVASHTPRPTPTATPRPTATATPTDTPAPSSAAIRGRILLNGTPPDGVVWLTLEDQAYQALRAVEVAGGDYRFENLPASAEGYNVVFMQGSNPQFGVEEVVSWAWIGPLAVQDGAVVDLPDLEIGLLGLTQTDPPADAFVGAITPQAPLTLAWDPYPDASRYWVDLHAGRALQRVWQSDAVAGTSVSFDGILDSGETLTPGTYWWRVGAQVDGINMTLSGPLEGFTVRP